MVFGTMDETLKSVCSIVEPLCIKKSQHFSFCTYDMTGSELTDLLKAAYSFDPNDNVPNIPYYVASGLRIKFAPWASKKLLSVTLENGRPLEDDTRYNVALWGWPFDFKYPGSLLKVYDDSCDDILTEAIQKDGTVKPFDDDRFQLDYSKTEN